jgi:hypothetical protein
MLGTIRRFEQLSVNPFGLASDLLAASDRRSLRSGTLRAKIPVLPSYRGPATSIVLTGSTDAFLQIRPNANSRVCHLKQHPLPASVQENPNDSFEIVAG